MPFNFNRNNPYVDYAQGQNAAPAQSNGLSDQSLLTGGYDPGLMQKVGNILPGLVGLKDIDYPYIRSQVRIENGVAVLKDSNTLDYKKGDSAGNKDAAALGKVAVDRANQLLEANGLYGQSGVTMNLDVGMASGRKGSNLGTGMFVGHGGSFESGSTYTGLESMADFGSQLDRYISDTVSSKGWGEIANVPQYSEANFVPSQGAGSFDNTSVVGRMLLNAAAVAAGGYAFSQLATVPAGTGSIGGSTVGGTVGGSTVGGTVGGSTVGGAVGGSTVGGAVGGSTLAGAALPTVGVVASAPALSAGTLALTGGAAVGAGASILPNVTVTAPKPGIGFDALNAGTGGAVSGGTEWLSGNYDLPEVEFNLGQPSLEDVVTQKVDETISAIGPNSADVINGIPGSLPLGAGTGATLWDKLSRVAKEAFMDPDGTVNWTSVAKAGLLGANVVSGVLGSVPDGGGDGSGGAGQNPYVAPDWVTGKLPDRPDPGNYMDRSGNYMDRSGEWTPGLSPGEQSNLLAMGKAPPKDYTQNNAVPFQPQRMLVDPSLNTLPKQQNMPALPITAQGGLASAFQNVDPNRPAGSIDSERRQGFGGLGGIDPNYVPTGNSPFSNLTPEQIERLRRQMPNPNTGGRQAAPGGLPPLQALRNLPRGF